MPLKTTTRVASLPSESGCEQGGSVCATAEHTGPGWAPRDSFGVSASAPAINADGSRTGVLGQQPECLAVRYRREAADWRAFDSFEKPAKAVGQDGHGAVPPASMPRSSGGVVGQSSSCAWKYQVARRFQRLFCEWCPAAP